MKATDTKGGARAFGSLALAAAIASVLGGWAVASRRPDPGGPGGGAGAAFFREMRSPPGAPKHVHFMHLDGFRPDLFKALLDDGRLPHFAFLAERGKVSFEASTVDKSETMKVIEAYLTSRRDTFIVGWWQWSRQSFQYQNYWLDPAEVANYALGLSFPRYPTVFDFLSAKGQGVASGFGLHRRSVPFANYSRAYLEGAQAVSRHTYYDQAHATMSGARRVYERLARERGPMPALSTSLLAAADEFAHLEGVIRAPADRLGSDGEACFERGTDARLEALFVRIEEDDRDGGKHGVARHFTRLDRSPGSTPARLCLRVPRLTVHADATPGGKSSRGESREDFAGPRYALGMIAVDIELGYLIDTLRSIRFEASGAPRFDPAWGTGLAAYRGAGVAEGSLFESTLFVLNGDHGMADTRRMMTPVDAAHPDPNRDPGSLDVTFVEALDRELGLATGDRSRDAGPDQLLGIDDTLQPRQIARPYQARGWQSAEIQALTAEAERWAADFVAEVEGAIKDEAHRKYWWLKVLQSRLIDPRIDGAFSPHEAQLRALLAALYLKGEPRYVEAELRELRSVYARQVRLVYGGGARNNAELFLPSSRDGALTWERRPSGAEIFEYRPAGPGGARLLDVLRRNAGVGLVFVRLQNGELTDSYAPREGRMEIACLDRHGNRGDISVDRDRRTGELIYGYRVPEESPDDPLGYAESPGAASPTGPTPSGTIAAWSAGTTTTTPWPGWARSSTPTTRPSATSR